MNSKLFLVAFTLLGVFAISKPYYSLAGSGKTKPVAKQRFTVTGDIGGMPVHTVTLELLKANDSISFVDSQRSNAAGHFELSGAITEPGLYRVHFQSDRFILLSIDKGTTKVMATWPVNDYTIEGSGPSARLNAFIDTVRNIMDKLKKSAGRLDSIKATGNEGLISSAQMALQDMNANFTGMLKQYCDTTPYEPNAILAARVINPEGQIAFFESFGKSLERRFPGTELTKQYQQYFRKLKESMPQPTEIGDKAPELKLEDTNGKTIPLSSLQGKYVLLDFWASWCGPCRAENPNVLAAYKKYKDRNFAILAVSLDSKKDMWLKAVSHDGLLWPQVSDLKGWQSVAATKYGVHSIPTNFLLDPRGVIIAKSLRGPDLENKLEEVLPR